MTDSRIKNNSQTQQQPERQQGNGSDERTARQADDARQPRAMEDRANTESRQLSDDERVEMLRNNNIQAALPNLPLIDGFHVCWLTTMNPRDSIQARMRLGYTPIKPEDVPGFDVPTQKSGEFAGFISVNEMLAFKIPLSLYQRYMQEAHHDAPNREDEKLTSTADFIRQQAEANNARIVEGDGITALRTKRPRPHFAG